jgi:hypothetical protein
VRAGPPMAGVFEDSVLTETRRRQGLQAVLESRPRRGPQGRRRGGAGRRDERRDSWPTPNPKKMSTALRSARPRPGHFCGSYGLVATDSDARRVSRTTRRRQEGHSGYIATNPARGYRRCVDDQGDQREAHRHGSGEAAHHPRAPVGRSRARLRSRAGLVVPTGVERSRRHRLAGRG